MTICLSREGIFPLVDENGVSSTGWSFPGTIQGEGKLCGMPSIFIRTQGCNFRCKWICSDGSDVWCDTSHAMSTNCGSSVDVSVVAATVISQCSKSHINHVVLTGGEPFLQAEASTELLKRLHDSGLHTTVETNGSLFVPEALKYVSLLSISPKFIYPWGFLPHDYVSSVASCINELKSHMDTDFQLKFVVSKYDDENMLIQKLNELKRESHFIKNTDILLMPMGATKELLSLTAPIAAELAVKNGWRYTPRLHVDLWNNKERT